MVQHLLLRLRAPLIAFGGETIDNYGVIRDFPALSMVTGLMANALGWDRGDDTLHNRLQERMVMGARLDASGERLEDYQTALIYEDDAGWTTHGKAEGRKKSPSYSPMPDGRRGLTLQRYRHYHADMNVLVALRLKPAEEAPTLDDLATALDKPARPLFVGRKNCLPTDRLMAGLMEADNILSALQLAVPALSHNVRAQWPDGEGRLPDQQDRTLDVCDERNWTSGVHGGWRPVREGVLLLKPHSITEQEAA
ncbi:type I-E CRISPR-associated protein Cas5/CasD [Limnohabitans curvus]|uniref:Type I-E CRISPR-associated protein Cas5/CasD n=1 Tax=Limnohabitans curvus TaxID=323423 RepID=A0A315EKV1_9BURK|nr:type I-E CRISPR-associated protein Cas5/CasD [Limnohabitans curvus]PUE56514.1 type I-E CRISPR-associated protein Cas5/CasD [Limnohabitans curvus]